MQQQATMWFVAFLSQRVARRDESREGSVAEQNKTQFPLLEVPPAIMRHEPSPTTWSIVSRYGPVDSSNHHCLLKNCVENVTVTGRQLETAS